MTHKTIASVGCEIPGGFSDFVEFTSNASLLDADIILFDPDLGDLRIAYERYQGKPSLSDSESFRLREAADHWKIVLREAFSAGKTIFVILRDLQEVYVDTGERQYSGTGRNRQTTRIVAPFNNYQLLPLKLTVTAAHGVAMKLTPDATVLQDYWREFGSESEYRIFLEAKLTTLVTTKSGNKTVGALLLDSATGGAMFLLPYLDLNRDEFTVEVSAGEDASEAGDASGNSDGNEGEEGDDDTDEQAEAGELAWTDEARSFGARLASCLCEIDKAVRGPVMATPAPSWAASPNYLLPGEPQIRMDLLAVETELERLRDRKEELKTRLATEGALRHLLYEKGVFLEAAILQALKLLGFQAERYRESDSEFDAVFVSREGRFLGEAEGRDSKAVGVDKLRQLQMNLHEDFERPAVKEMAKAVLFGNAHRLRPVDERSECFTAKCMTAAKRGAVALVRTPDLFRVAQHLSGTPDMDFAARCRAAILHAAGEVVAFPDPPTRIPTQGDAESPS